MSDLRYPVRLTGRLDPPLSRWLWLVKWLLLLPHFVVLAFLWVGVLFVSIGAFFAVLATGRYPDAMFDYTVGVLRWTWRVNFYGYNALATDRYPPFTLADVPDYPARLEIDRPGELSRGLVLVKWWLLALPHYLVVAALTFGTVFWPGANHTPIALIDLLAIVGAVSVMVRRPYPTSVLDLVVGLNRWVFRVAGYALLLTDDYPPFRLDMGPADPGDRPAVPPPPTPRPTPAGTFHG